MALKRERSPFGFTHRTDPSQNLGDWPGRERNEPDLAKPLRRNGVAMLARRRKPKLPPGVYGVARDRWGRTVTLTEKIRVKIVSKHKELDGRELAILTAVEQAEHRTQGKKAGKLVQDREVLWASGLGDGRWLRVVVRYKQKAGTILSAYAGNRDPEDADLI
jgi:hypothetical protein